MRLARPSWALALVLAGSLLSAADAAAAVDIGPSRITVSGDAAGAIITREPLNVSFTDGSGRTVLSQVTGVAGVQVVPPVVRPQFATQGTPPSTLYAPFTFLVGTSSLTQTPAGQWEGTLTSVTEGGVEYGATRVLDAKADGGGVRLVLATTDPSGRTLTARIDPGPKPGTMSVSVTPDQPADVAAMGDSFSASPTESFHGFGGRHNSVDQRGSEFYNYLQQENISSGSADGFTAASPTAGADYLFPNGAQAAYYVQSSFISSDGYGFLLDRDENSHWRMASDRADAWQVQASAPALDYVVAPGSARAAIGSLTAISGRQHVPPKWALGPILDREVIFQNDPAEKYEGEVERDLADFRRYGFHPSAYRIEGWQFLPDDFLHKVIDELRARDIRPMVYFRSFVGQDTIGTDDPSLYDEAIARGFVATHADGTPYTFISNFNAPAAQIDFTNPDAVHWWQRRIRAALRLGAEGFMEDFGEQVLDDMHFADGSTGATMHNRLPVLYHRATFEAVHRFESHHPKRKIFYFSRAGYSGTPGSARYEFANFPGDETTDWTRSSGLASQTPDLLNRGVGGAYGFTTDIGGFFDVGPYSPTTKELFIRWSQWAALSPMFRLHGSVLAGVHMPWTFDEQTLRRYKALAALHRRAQPLILRLWQRAKRTGIPIARPLWLAAPGDAMAAKQDQEWLLGPHVLVAPVVTEGADTRDVYFPAGCWRSRGGKRYEGPAQVTVSAPLARLPFFTSCGKHPF
jgi:alpha-glucosidase